jgi:hypothetical protein
MHVQGNDLRRHCASLNLVIAILSVISYPALHALCFIVIFSYLAYLHVYYRCEGTIAIVYSCEGTIVIRCDCLQMGYCVSVVCNRLCYVHAM